ncbi:hypothetical protein [Deinococcus knuensis]|uniref:Uncharacterized protein n=1 Tax=Deinococcus knuensis TaxID=1837380 RepID=A0ABQ2SXW4_9DEIO|nr:hypothetical protein [Deinococcus knuensis]GGS43527.1 hypothetical protein GCM10008961_38180 [Deinococcus knuensis]
MPSRTEQDILNVLGKQRQELTELEGRGARDQASLDSAIRDAEATLTVLGVALPTPRVTPAPPSPRGPLPDWEALATAARMENPQVRIEELLTADAIAAVDRQIHEAREAVLAPYRLDGVDVAIAGIAGVLAGVVDVALVGVPPAPPRLGQPARPGGTLNTWVRDAMQRGVPEDLRREYERFSKVPYDPSINSGLGQHIPGLTPSTHRLHSLGHDPLLGFIVGVADILRGTFTAVGQDGKLICQTNAPERMVAGLFAALAKQFKHLLSDVNTPAGLPAPLMGLSQFMQFGQLTDKNLNVAELTRLMYRDGYDFRHFLATTIPVLLIEVLVRVAFLARQLALGKSFKEAFPHAGQPKLRTMLVVAHGTAAGINAGKIAVSRNPLSFSMAQWAAFGRYLLPELKLRLVDLPRRSDLAVQDLIDRNWVDLQADLETLWAQTGPNFDFEGVAPAD